MVELFLLTFGGMVTLVAMMAVGVMFGHRCLRGSCGGLGFTGSAGDSLTCATCPLQKAPAPVSGD